MKNPNWNKTAEDYAAHRAGFPPSIYPRLEKFGVGKLGQQILEVGAGTGNLGRGFAKQGAQVVASDIAVEMLRQGQVIDQSLDLPTRYLGSQAERLPFPENSFDGIASGQSWHWFDQALIFNEVKRVLKPGGLIVIAHFDWLPVVGNVVAATEELIMQFNPKWDMAGGNGVHPEWLPGLMAADFRGLEMFSYDIDVPYSHVNWRGRIRASAGISASLTPADVEQFDQAHAALLQADFKSDPLAVPHRVFAIVGINQ